MFQKIITMINNCPVALNDSYSFGVHYFPYCEGDSVHSHETGILTDLSLREGSIDTREKKRV
jgi:hypothetical protein